MVNKKNLQGLPFCMLAFPLFAAMFYSGAYFGFRTALIVGVVLLILFYAFFVCIIPTVAKKPLYTRYTVFFICAFFLASLTLTRFLWTNIPLQTLIPRQDITSLTGIVRSSPTRTSKGDYLVAFESHTASSASINASAIGLVTLFIPHELVEAYYPGKLYTQTQPFIRNTSQLPFIEQGLTCTFYGRIANSSNMYFVDGVSSLEHTGWDSALNKVRASFRLNLKRLLYSWGEAGGFLLALLSGSREYLNAETANGFKSAGLSHVLALSGMHLSLFGGLSAALAKIIGGKRIASAVSLIFMAIFVWFAGVSPSLFRALLCASLMVLCIACGQKPKMLEVLCSAFIIQTLMFPSHAMQLSFMLSYGALFGIVLLGPLLDTVIPLSKSISSPFTTSFSAQVFTAPITIGFFSTLTPIGVLASVVVSPLALWFLTIGIISIPLVLLIPTLIEPIGTIMHIFYTVIEQLVVIFAKMPMIQF